MYQLHAKQDRLFIISVSAPNHSDELTGFRADVVNPAAKHPGGVILFVDVTRCSLLLPTVAKGYTDIMRADNENIIRSVLWINDKEIFSQQLARMVQEAGNPKRQAVSSKKEATTLLYPLLKPTEWDALQVYMRKVPG